MTYARVDDQFTEHPKVLEIGPLGEALWLRGLLYASRNLTDGFVPMAFLRRMGDMDALQQVPHLIAAGLWHECEGGYRIHDYDDWQRTKADIDAIAEVRAQAGRVGGIASGEARRRKIEANEANANGLLRSKRSKSNTAATADTDTDTEQTSPPTPPSGANGYVRPRWEAAVGRERWETVTKAFTEVNVQLDASWLRSAVALIEREHPGLDPDRTTTALRATLIKAQDALGRENRIRNPRAFVSKELQTAISEVEQRGQGTDPRQIA